MNTYTSQYLVWDHITQLRQQAAAASWASAARGAQRRAGTHARRAGHRLVRGA